MASEGFAATFFLPLNQLSSEATPVFCHWFFACDIMFALFSHVPSLQQASDGVARTLHQICCLKHVTSARGPEITELYVQPERCFW